MTINALKLIAALPFSWLLYAVGHAASKVLVWRDSEAWSYFWYPLYNHLMILSSKVQDWAGGDKWFPWFPASPYPEDKQ